MPASWKIAPSAERTAEVRRTALAVAAVAALILGVAAATAVMSPAAMQIFAIPATHRAPPPAAVANPAQTQDPAASPWAGGLESPQSRKLGPERPALTSAAYTTGFDRRAAGLGPLPPESPAIKLTQPRDPRACPDDLNCSFRPLKSAAAAPAAATPPAGAPSVTPPRRPIVAAPEPAPDPTKQPQPAGFALLTSHLHLPPYLVPYVPSAKVLLKPFNFVGNLGNSVSNSVVGFVKKL